MKEALFLCLLLALVGTLLRLVIESAGARAAAKTVTALCSLLALFVLADAVRGGVQVVPVMDFRDETAYFQSLSAETLDAVCREAEKMLAERLCIGITDKCGHAPASCCAVLNRENLQVSAVTVRFVREDLLLSSYEVKAYVRAQCGTDTEVEVVFE